VLALEERVEKMRAELDRVRRRAQELEQRSSNRRGA